MSVGNFVSGAACPINRRSPINLDGVILSKRVTFQPERWPYDEGLNKEREIYG